MNEYRGYNIGRDATHNILKIKTIGKGGSLPDVLAGSYTDYPTAKRSVDSYLDRDKNKVVEKNVNTTTRDS